jgi:hypothetical protein
VPYVAQLDESDLGFLRRLGRRHDALATIANGMMLLIPRGFGMAASGKTMPAVEVGPNQVRRVETLFTDHRRFGRVAARAYDARLAKSVARGSAAEGATGPIHWLRSRHLDPTDAQKHAQSTATRLSRAEQILKIDMQGDARIMLGSLIAVTGFRNGVDGTWSVTAVCHRIDGEGYGVTLHAELTTDRAREEKQEKNPTRAR